MEFRPMSPEEIERTMQFLLHQQAQFAADFEKLSAKTDRLTDAMVGLTGIVGQIAEAQHQTEHQLRETNVRVSELAEHGKIIDSHMDVLIQTVERHLREDHGHRPS